jgi:alpha-D-xyloside xylohydrolase
MFSRPQLSRHSCGIAASICQAAIVLTIFFCVSGVTEAVAQENSIVLSRDGRTVVLEPYAPNILRITLSKSKPMATAAPGYGFSATPSMTGWTHEQASDASETVRSGRLVVHLSPPHTPEAMLPHPMPLDDLNNALREHYFGGDKRSEPDDSLSVSTASGKMLINMHNWRMSPNPPETAVIAGG